MDPRVFFLDVGVGVQALVVKMAVVSEQLFIVPKVWKFHENIAIAPCYAQLQQNRSPQGIQIPNCIPNKEYVYKALSKAAIESKKKE